MKIDEKQAIEKYLKNNKKLWVMVDRLTKWDTKLTLKENAKTLGLSQQLARGTSEKYDLDYVGKIKPMFKITR